MSHLQPDCAALLKSSQSGCRSMNTSVTFLQTSAALTPADVRQQPEVLWRPHSGGAGGCLYRMKVGEGRSRRR